MGFMGLWSLLASVSLLLLCSTGSTLSSWGWEEDGRHMERGNICLPAHNTSTAGSKHKMEQRGTGSPCNRGGTAGKELSPVLQSCPLLPNPPRVCRNSRLGTRGGFALLTDSSRAGSAGMTQAGSGSESGAWVAAELPAPGNSQEEINASAGAVPSLALPQQPHLCCL